MLKKSNSKWKSWINKYNCLLKSSVFEDYERAEKIFFSSKEFQEYRDAERNMIWDGLLMYLGDNYERQYDLHGTPKYIRWVPKLFKVSEDD